MYGDFAKWKHTLITFRKFSKGLDSATAITVVEALKGIAVTQNATLVVTIHQPSARLYAMFNKCLFLAGTVEILSFVRRISLCHDTYITWHGLLNGWHIHLIGGKVTYTGPSSGLHDYATLIYQKANLGIPLAANAPEVIPHSSIADLVVMKQYSQYWPYNRYAPRRHGMITYSRQSGVPRAVRFLKEF